MAKETVPNRRYTDEFKLEALRLAESVGINQAAKRLGMPSSSLRHWARLKRSGKLGELPRAGPIKGSPTELEGAAHGYKSKFRNSTNAHPRAPPKKTLRFPSSIVHPDLEVGIENSIPKSDAEAWAAVE
jgi:transposase-like protein